MAIARKTTLSTSVTNGPAIAIRSSDSADGISPRNRATPPKSHSVIPSIATPSRWA